MARSSATAVLSGWTRCAAGWRTSTAIFTPIPSCPIARLGPPPGRRTRCAIRGRVHEGVGGTGVVALVRNGDGPVVLLRADMDALPVREATGLPYASTATATVDGARSPSCTRAATTSTSHACWAPWTCWRPRAEPGRARGRGVPAGGGGRRRCPRHGRGRADEARASRRRGVVPARSAVPRRPGRHPCRSDAVGCGQHAHHRARPRSPRVDAAGRGRPRRARRDDRRPAADGRLPRGPPGDPAVLTVGSVQAGTKSNVIPDAATIQLNVRTYSEQTRSSILAAIERIVTAECDASGSPEPPQFELFDRFPVTDNDPALTAGSRGVLRTLRRRGGELPVQTASEDFSDLPNAFGAPYTYWGIGGIGPAPLPPSAADRPRRAGRAGQPLCRLRPRRPADPGHRHLRPGGRRARLPRRARGVMNGRPAGAAR